MAAPAGTLLIERGGEEAVGRGSLGAYTANSNTRAYPFVKNVLKDGLRKLPSETAKNTSLSKLTKSQVRAFVRTFGPSAPTQSTNQPTSRPTTTDSDARFACINRFGSPSSPLPPSPSPSPPAPPRPISRAHRYL